MGLGRVFPATRIDGSAARRGPWPPHQAALGARAHALGEERQGIGVDPIGLGELASGRGEVAHLPGIGDDHREPGRREGGDRGALVSARGLQDDERRGGRRKRGVSSRRSCTPRPATRRGGRSGRFRPGSRSAAMQRSGARSIGTGSGWSRSTSSRVSAGSICGRRTGRIALRGGAVADDRGQAVQKGRERDGGDLEDAAHRGEDLPAARRARVARRCRERRGVRQLSACREPAR